MSAFGQSKRTKAPRPKDEPLRLIRDLKWHTPNLEDRYGKNIAIVGRPMGGKTLLALLAGFFNSEYTKEIREAGYESVLEVMKSGLLPEIERIMVLESENNLLKSLTTGIEKKLFRPFIEKGIMEVAPIIIPRKEVMITEDNKVVSIRRTLIEQLKQQFDEAVKEIVADEPESTLFIIDSMSAYKKLLDDKFGLLYEVLNKRENAVFEGVDTYRQSFYASRNSWWQNLMQSKRGFKGWNIDTYKASDIPEHYLKPGENAFSIKWVTGTEHDLDMVFKIDVLNDGVTRQIEILKGRYSPSKPEDHKFYYPLNSRMGAMPMINSMCEKLLMGEEIF